MESRDDRKMSLKIIFSGTIRDESPPPKKIEKKKKKKKILVDVIDDG